jgi:dihydropteroate synthase
LERLYARGANDVILDPGIGFGKELHHNYQILSLIRQFQNIFQLPILIGASRKSMINKVLGTKAAEALAGTVVINTIALLEGANILRVHDVLEAKQAIKLVAEFKKHQL